MGMLNSDSVTVDAILTKLGRKRLAKGTGLNIDGFALLDDFVNYKDYNPAHPSGSAQYGSAITSMPLPEAFPNALNAARFPLVSGRSRNTIFHPIIFSPNYPDNQVARITDHGDAYGIEVAPMIENLTGFDGHGYTFAFSDIKGMHIIGGTKIELDGSVIPSNVLPRGAGGPNPAKYMGGKIKIVANGDRKAFETIVTISHEKSGAAPTSLRVLFDGSIKPDNTDKIKLSSAAK